MSTPARPIPRKFYRVAYQRFEEAEVLFEAGYYIGAVYLAGYAIECIRKTLILEATPEKDHTVVETEFRGPRAHDYEWLRHRYRQTHAPEWSTDISQALTFVGTWETALRYTPGVGTVATPHASSPKRARSLRGQIAVYEGREYPWSRYCTSPMTPSSTLPQR
jgi:hypothetical protein